MSNAVMYPSFGNKAPAEIVNAALRKKGDKYNLHHCRGMPPTSAVRVPAKKVKRANFSSAVDDFKVGLTRSKVEPVMVIISSGKMTFMNQ